MTVASGVSPVPEYSQEPSWTADDPDISAPRGLYVHQTSQLPDMVTKYGTWGTTDPDRRWTGHGARDQGCSDSQRHFARTHPARSVVALTVLARKSGSWHLPGCVARRVDHRDTTAATSDPPLISTDDFVVESIAMPTDAPHRGHYRCARPGEPPIAQFSVRVYGELPGWPAPP